MKLKKMMAVITSLCMTFLAVVPVNVGAVSDMGDIDGNGAVTSSDALEILNDVAGLKSLTDEQFKCSDIDGDGVITSYDSLNILQYVVEAKNSLYEKYSGVKWIGKFGEERVSSYIDPLGWEFSDLYIEITSIDDKDVSGSISLSASGMSDTKKFGKQYNANEISSIENGVFNINDTEGAVQINIDITFNGDELIGNINSAELMGQEFEFPIIYFEKQ